MQANSLPKFYVGQKVVCIRPHGDGIVKKGVVYTVLGISKSPCGCRWLINVGAYVPPQYSSKTLECSECDCVMANPFNPYAAIGHVLFVPVQEQSFPLMSFAKIHEKEKEHILINN